MNFDDVIGGLFQQTGELPEDNGPVSPQLIADRLTRKALTPLPPRVQQAPPPPRARRQAPTADFGQDDEIIQPAQAADFGADDEIIQTPLPRARPSDAPAPAPQSLDPFGMGKGPNLRPDMGQAPEEAAPPPTPGFTPPMANFERFLPPSEAPDAPRPTGELSQFTPGTDWTKPYEITKGFTGGLTGSNPKMFGDAMEGIGVLTDNETLKNWGGRLSKDSQETLDANKARVPSFVDIKNLSDAAAYAGYSTGQGIGTSVPSLVTGGLAALFTANPLIGLGVGALGPSYIQNYGDVYGSARDDKDIAERVKKGELTPKQLAGVSALAAVPMAALDVLGLETMLGATVFREAKQELMKRILKGVAIGAISEGSTEGLQEVISQWAQHYLGSQTGMKEKVIAVVDNVFGGIFAGGAMGGAGGAAQQKAAPPPIPAPIPAPAASPAGITAPAAPPATPPGPPATSPLPGSGDLSAPAEVPGSTPQAPSEQPAAPPSPPSQTVSAPKDSFDEDLTSVLDEQFGPTEAAQSRNGQIESKSAEAPEAPLLRAYGYTDDQIEAMTPKQRAAEAKDAVEAGTEVPAAGQSETNFGQEDRIVGKRNAPVDDLTAAGAVVNTEPTEAQKAAGNYQKGHVRYEGLDVTIENPKGSTRTGTGPNGETWQTVMPGHYGYVKRTKGADGDHVDVLIGDQQSGGAFVVDQVDPATGKFDEHKVMLGVPDEAAARAMYEAQFSDGSGPERIGAITPMSPAKLKGWLANGTASKPVGKINTAKPVEKKQARATRPMSVAEFLASEGGIRPDPDLRAIYGGKGHRIVIPGLGFRSVLRGGGMTMQQAHEKLMEAGYLPRQSENAPNDAHAAERIRQILDEENRGRKSFAQGEELTGEDDKAKREREIAEDQIADATSDVHTMLEEAGIPVDSVDAAQIKRAAEMMLATGQSADQVWEAAVMADAVDSGLLNEAQIGDIYGEDGLDVLRSAAAHEGGQGNSDRGAEVAQPTSGAEEDGRVSGGVENVAAFGQADERVSRPDEPAEAAGDRPSVQPGLHGAEGAVANSAEAQQPDQANQAVRVEATPAGQQTVLPGAEKIGQGEQAQRKADQPLKPKVAQKPADIGMFGDESQQTDLVDLAAKAPETGPSSFKITERTRAVKGGGTETAYALYKDGKPAGVFKSREEAEAAAKPASSFDDDLNAVLDEQFGAKEKKPVTPQLPPAGGGTKYVLPSFATAQHTEQRTKTQVAKSAAKNTAEAADAALDGLIALFGGGKTVGMALNFDEDTYAKAKPMFITAAGKFTEALTDAKELLRRIVTALKERNGFTREVFEKMSPYLRRFVDEVRSGVIKLGEAETTKPAQNITENITATLADAFAAHFAKGEGFPTIVQARKFAKDAGFSEDPKAIEEAIELALVKTARDIAKEPDAFNKLVDLYGRQPRLGTRTSTQMRDQAFSTPVPLAFVASRLAGITDKTWVLEPTAGNGALLIEANPDHSIVNEFNPQRVANLESQGFRAVEGDATAKGRFDKYKADVVIANPPFGAVQQEGNSQVYDLSDIQPGYSTTQIDHVISLRALAAMKDDGKGVLIIGGPAKTAVSQEARSSAYNTKAKREFFKVLYDRYNVVDHFTVAGELYERQGAGWPVDVIVIDGRKKSALKLPAVAIPRILDSWEAVGGTLDRSSLDQTQKPDAGATDVGTTGGDGGVREDGERQPSVPAEPQDGGDLGGGVHVGSRNGEAGGSGADQRNEPTVRGESARPDRPIDAERRPQRVEQETATQVAYTPKSAAGDNLGTLVPVNMRTSISDALDALAEKHGDLDEYVADALGYSVAELGTYFAPEQVDALALALDNIAQGKGFIIGDQTGIGKGRVNAGIIRFAIKSGRVPIFVTEKPNLYGDMYRDLSDTGIQGFLGREPRIIATNSDLALPLDEEGKQVLKTAAGAKHSQHLESLLRGDKLADSYDMVFTTYSQMQTVKGQPTARQVFLGNIAPNAVVIFDESHNAGGQGAKEDPKKPTRAGFARSLVSAAKGVFYSSATYAKRPDVMDLYSKTDMSLAVDKPEQLGEAIARGGVPMQQVVASMLAKAGQYIRRERSFAGVTYNTPSVAVDHVLYDEISGALAAIQAFSEARKGALKDINDQIKGEAGSLSPDGSTGGAGASSVNFTAVMHNLINQMLLSLKVEPAAKMAIEALKRGQKPVLTLANTMESFLKDFANDLGIEIGEKIDGNFSKVLHKYLERTRTITIKKPFSKEKGVKHYLTDEELGPRGLAAYNSAKALINSMDLTSLSLSPIDRLKSIIEKAGYKVGEITGRNSTVDYSGKFPVLAARGDGERSIKGRRATIKKFNNGELDVVILNQAGSTGISLHASKTFKDQKQRHMILVQPEANIDTHMQMLGRVHRTGQVVLPEYSQMIADIPAEKRPAAVLAKKMASLNASTTASRGGALRSEAVADFMNIYGDMVAAAYIAENPEMNRRLGDALTFKETGGVDSEDAIRKMTGRIPLLPLAEQEHLYETLEAEYDALLKQMDASGQNALEAKTLDLQAQPISSAEVVERKGNSTSPFAAPVTIEKVSVRRLGKPMSSEEVVKRVAEELGQDASGVTKENAANSLDNLGQIGANQNQLRFQDESKEFDEYRRKILAAAAEDADIDVIRGKLGDVRDRWRSMLNLLTTGARVTLKTADGNLAGIVLKVEHKGKAKNPLALSTWKATFAIADASRQIVVPFSRLFEDGKAPTDDDLTIDVAKVENWLETHTQTLERFEHGQRDTREERYIATGNLLAAYSWLNAKGQIVNYTDASGAVRQGIMTRKDFDFTEHAARKGKTVPAAMIPQWLREHPNKTIESVDGAVRLAYRPNNNTVDIMVERAKRVGGQYYLDKQLTNLIGRDFYLRNNSMQASVRLDDMLPVAQRLFGLGALFTEQVDAPKMGGPKIASVARPNTGPVYTPAFSQRRADVMSMLRDVVHRVAGPGVDVHFLDGFGQDANIDGWGRLAQEGVNIDGQYNLIDRVIELSLDSYDPGSTALHEAFHDVENQLLTDRELELMKAETERLRPIVQQHFGFSAEDMPSVAGYEIRAMAFEVYAHNREQGRATTGLLPAITRAFERLVQLFRAVRNGLAGMGFQTAESVFKQAYEGNMAGRESRQQRGEKPGIDASSLAAIGPRRGARVVRPRSGNLPVPQLEMPHESVREALRDPTLSRTERLSAALDALMLTPSRALWDKLIDLSRLQRAAEMTSGQKVPERLDTYLAASLYPGRAGERLNDAARDLFEPVYDAMKAQNVSRAELHEYLYARHAAERNEQIRQIDPANNEGSGMSDADAQDILDRVANSGRQGAFDAVTERVDAVVEHNRDLMEREGLESGHTLLQWQQAYKYYVPLKGAEASEDEYGTPSKGKGFNVKGAESLRALGRFSKAGDILVNLLDQTQRTIIRAEKNRVGKAFLRFIQRNPSPLYRMGLAETRRRINPRTGLVETVWVTTSADQDHVFAVKVGGKVYYVQIEHEGLLTALKNIGIERLNPFFRMVAAFTRQYSAFQTARNPEFVLTNFLRDIQDAGLSLNAEQQRGFKRAFMKNLFSGHSLVSAVLGEAGKTNNRFGRLYEEWRLAGGKISMFGYKDIAAISKDVQQQLERRTESTTKKVLMQPLRTVNPFSGHVVKLFEAMSDVTESATRLAVYAAAREVGLTQAQAAKAARSMTVDFNAGGKHAPVFAAFYAFAKPAMLGTVNLMRRLKSKNMRRAAAGVAMTGFAMTLWNLWASPGDDDDKDKTLYEKKKYFEREKNILFYVPGKPDPIKIPMGYALQPFYMAGENAAMALMGKIKPLEAFTNWLGTTAKAFNPVGGEGSIASWAFWMGAISPTITDPVFELGRNRNWLDRPIHPDEMPWTKGKPHSQQSKVTTNPYAEATAEWLNKVTGGHQFKKGAIDAYPDDLEYAWNFALGGMGKFIANSGGLVKDKIDGVDTPVERMPFVRRFISPDHSIGAVRSDFYEKSHEARENVATVRDALKADSLGLNVDDAGKTIRELGPKVGLGQGPRGGNRFEAESVYRGANKELQELRLQEKNIRNSTSILRTDRGRLLEENHAQQRRIMQDANRGYRALQPAEQP